MLTSERTAGRAVADWLGSRKNIVATVLALVVLVLHVVVGLGPAWPFFVVGAYVGGALVTPARRRPQLNRPADPHSLAAAICEEERRLAYAHGAAPEVQRAVAALGTSLRKTLTRWDELAEVPEQQLTVREIAEEHLPAVISGYLEVPDLGHPRAVEETVESAAVLLEETEKIRAAVLENSLTELSSHAEALRLRFGRLPRGR
ncbi:hypothetical protein [Corynebacterium frankenforstense]